MVKKPIHNSPTLKTITSYINLCEENIKALNHLYTQALEHSELTEEDFKVWDQGAPKRLAVIERITKRQTQIRNLLVEWDVCVSIRNITTDDLRILHEQLSRFPSVCTAYINLISEQKMLALIPTLTEAYFQQIITDLINNQLMPTIELDIGLLTQLRNSEPNQAKATLRLLKQCSKYIILEPQCITQERLSPAFLVSLLTQKDKNPTINACCFALNLKEEELVSRFQTKHEYVACYNKLNALFTEIEQEV